MPTPDDTGGVSARNDGGAPARNGGIELRSPTAIFEDERAIEGLPIRLVIALLVGVAALSIMMTMIDETSGIGKTELDAEPKPDTIELSEDAIRDVTITVVDQGGEPVSGARVVLQGSSARLSGGTKHEESGRDGTVTFEDVTPELEDNQDQGTLEIDLKHSDSQFKDERSNAEIFVLE